MILDIDIRFKTIQNIETNHCTTIILPALINTALLQSSPQHRTEVSHLPRNAQLLSRLPRRASRYPGRPGPGEMLEKIFREWEKLLVLLSPQEVPWRKRGKIVFVRSAINFPKPAATNKIKLRWKYDLTRSTHKQ